MGGGGVIKKLPQGWVIAKLDEVADALDYEREPINSSERSKRVSGKLKEQLFAYYGATGQVGLIDDFRSDGERVLLGEDGAPFLDSSKDKAYLVNGKFWVNNHAHVLQGAAGYVSNRFLCHQLNTVDYQPFVAGSTRLKLTSAAMKQIPLSVAPAAEQTRIVEKLEELLSDLDAGVAELKAAQKKLAQYRQSLLKAAVEGALTADWRAAREAANAETETGAQLLARILTERRSRWQTRQLAKFEAQDKAPPKDWQAKYPEPVAPDTAGLPALPLGWVWASAEQLCDFITKGTTPSKGLDGAGDKVIPFLRVTNLTDKGVLDMADKVFVSEETHRGFLARSVVYPSDVLMNIVGPPLGQVSVVPETFPEWNINQAIAIYRAVNGVLSGFLSLTLLAPPAQRWLKARSKTTAGQTNLTLEVCRSLPIALPPLAEQQALISVADEAINRVAEQSQAIQISLKQSAAQRKNILQAAFSGQLVPQDPADEPASALLARIRAARAARKAGSATGRGKMKVST